MPILPVLDLLAGQVVRGIAGERSKYRPIVSKWCATAEPLDVARAFRGVFGLGDLYIADLDAIAGRVPAWETYRVLHDDGFRLWIDAGVRHSSEVRRLLEAQIASLILGLETLESPETLRTILAETERSRLVFSLDLKLGKPIAGRAWPGAPAAIAESATAMGIGRMIVLDLAAVGMGAGPTSLPFLKQLRERHPRLELTTGGGVRDVDDVQTLIANGADYVLVASALHDGRIQPSDLA